MLDWIYRTKSKPKCRFPDCGRTATTHWALVDLCDEHREIIRKETVQYYRIQKSSYWERVNYHKISHLVPWSRAKKEG